jgi:hypothetical protein
MHWRGDQRGGTHAVCADGRAAECGRRVTGQRDRTHLTVDVGQRDCLLLGDAQVLLHGAAERVHRRQARRRRSDRGHGVRDVGAAGGHAKLAALFAQVGPHALQMLFEGVQEVGHLLLLLLEALPHLSRLRVQLARGDQIAVLGIEARVHQTLGLLAVAEGAHVRRAHLLALVQVLRL